jgi:DNA-directed RNA polymerase subunit RPC12/RpoP
VLPVRVAVDFSLGEELVDFRCSRCGHVVQASVSGGGTGLRLNGASLSNAQLDARVGAAQVVRLAPCPRCGHRNRAALAKVALVGASVGAFAALATGLFVAEQLHTSRLGAAIAIQVALATFLVVAVAMTALKLRSVRRRVRFLRPAG